MSAMNFLVAGCLILLLLVGGGIWVLFRMWDDLSERLDAIQRELHYFQRMSPKEKPCQCDKSENKSDK